jgi:polar amino acid transport system substrate-binding protein
MKTLSTKLLGATLALATITTMSGIGDVAAQDSLARAKENGYIRVGFPNQVPYAYATAKGILTGADAELARQVIQGMGIKEMDGVLTEFASLIPGLKAGRFDMVLAMFVNPKRCAEIAFSEPIYGIGQALVVKSGNPKNIQSYDDLINRDDVKFAIMSGAVQGIYAKKLNIPSDRVLPFPDGPSAVAGVGTGRADAFGISSLSARRLVEAAGPDAGVELLAGFKDPIIDGKPARGYGAFGFRKEDKTLLAAFNETLAKVLGSPKHLETIKAFGFAEDNLPNKATADLCAGK